MKKKENWGVRQLFAIVLALIFTMVSNPAFAASIFIFRNPSTLAEVANVNDTGAFSGSIANAATADALSSDPTDCSANQFANAIAANGNLSCSALADGDIPDTITIDLAATATALASDPTDCSANQFANAIAASGNLSCSALVDADVPNSITIDLAATATALAADGANCPSGTFALGIDAGGVAQCGTVDAVAVNGSTTPVQSDALYDHDALSDAHHSQTTNTNANTICSGTTTYLDGEGGCDDLSSVYQPLDSDLTSWASHYEGKDTQANICLATPGALGNIMTQSDSPYAVWKASGTSTPGSWVSDAGLPPCA